MADNYYKEYGDLYKKAQDIGQYKMFLFDVKGSKGFARDNCILFAQNINNFVDAVTKDLLDMEKLLNKRILHRHLENFDNYNKETDKNKVVLSKNQRIDYSREVYRSDSINPLFWLGDMMHFIIERDSISDKVFFDIFEKQKEKFIPDYDLHYKSGYYETDVWAESGSKFSRIHCIPVLEQLAKQNKELIVTIKKANDLEK